MKKFFVAFAIILIAAKFPNLVEGAIGLSLDAATTVLTAGLKWADNGNSPRLPASTYQYGDVDQLPWQQQPNGAPKP